MLKRVVIADTSCLIVLTKIDALQFLKKLYQEIFVTPEIVTEFGDELPEWIVVEEVSDKRFLQILNTSLDLGEASAIALALEKKDSLLILDDLRGRREAEKLGLRITGTLGVLLKAKQQDVIKKIKPYIEKLKQRDFHISLQLEKEILELSGEK